MEEITIRKKIYIFISVFIALTALIGTNIYIQSKSASDTHNIKVASLKYEEIKSSIKVNGILEPVNKSDIFLASEVACTKVLVNKYDRVSKNQKLVEVDLSTLTDKENELTDNIRKSELLIEKYNILSERDINELNDKVNILNEDMKRLASDIDKLNKDYAENQKKLDTISPSDTNSYNLQKQLLDNIKSSLDEKQKVLDNDKNQKEELLNQADSVKKENQSDIDIESVNIKSCNDAISEIKSKIENINSSILSPIDGIVTSINIPNVTQYTPGQPAFTIMDDKALKVKIKISEAQRSLIKLNQSVNIKIDDYNSGQIYKGQITYISPIVEKNLANNQEESAFIAEASIENADDRLKIGVQCECQVDNSTDKVLTGDFSMLKEDKNGDYSVFVYNEKNNTVYQKKIKTGMITEEKVQITEGVAEGEKVVIDPQPSLKDGDVVKAVEMR